MSKAAATTTIIFRRKIGAISSLIVSPKGDLVQYYANTPSNPGKIYQNFTELKPALFLTASSSRAAESIKFSKSVDIYVNDTLITFDDGSLLSTNQFGNETGHFKRARSTDSIRMFDGMTIEKNLVTAFGGETVVVKMVGTQESLGQTESIKASYNIAVQKQTGTGYFVSIASGDENNFVITSKDPADANGKCLLKVNVYSFEGDGSSITDGLAYQWQIETISGWKNLSTSNQVSITADDVDTMANVRVIVKKSATNETIGSDIQTVRDNTDPYTFDLGATPKDETIEEGTGGTVTYKPRLLSNNKELSGFKFCFSIMDSAGNPLTKAYTATVNPEINDATMPQESFIVTEDMCRQASGNVALTIFAVEDNS